ncbi:cysteine-rich receptor protein [Salix suchowensis]|nr:cysteine-rich receptor protein [Salix suchowensis]
MHIIFLYKFPAHSAYQQNLNLTLTSLTSYGYVSTAGQNPDLVYGLVNCPGFLSVEDCQTCAVSVAIQIIQLCPNQKTASVIDENCSLQYSDRDFFSTADTVPRLDVFNGQNADDQDVFNSQLQSLLGNISFNAATDPSRLAVGRITYTSSTSIYGMVQCIRNLTANECLRCLQSTSRYILQRSGEAVDGVHEESYTLIDSFSIGLNTLREATGDFCDEYKLGEGGFGPVYKGELRSGKEIAVKRLSSSSGQGFEELRTEVMLVAKLLHRNLVQLLGFCLEENEKLLVYEYLPNGSLDKALFDKNSQIEWENRYKIIIGIARGLLYLHEDSQLRIVHRDLKASNVLLDESMQPKISDFGLAKLFPGSKTHGISNRIAGTCGYMAPEYAKKGHFSTQSDVYSFGILILEIVTGLKVSSFRNSINLQSYSSQVMKLLNRGIDNSPIEFGMLGTKLFLEIENACSEEVKFKPEIESIS